MKKPLTTTSGIMKGDCFKWAGADDFADRYICLESLSETDRAAVMRGVNINAARAAAAGFGVNIMIEGETKARQDIESLMTRLEAAPCAI